MIEQIIKYTMAGVCCFLSYLLGGYDILLECLLTFTALDILTGLVMAVINGSFSSKIMWHGGAKKVGTYFLVAVAVKLDILLNVNILRGGVIGFFIGVEGISIIENWGNMGLPIPKALKRVLSQLKNDNDKK